MRASGPTAGAHAGFASFYQAKPTKDLAPDFDYQRDPDAQAVAEGLVEDLRAANKMRINATESVGNNQANVRIAAALRRRYEQHGIDGDDLNTYGQHVSVGYVAFKDGSAAEQLRPMLLLEEADLYAFGKFLSDMLENERWGPSVFEDAYLTQVLLEIGEIDVDPATLSMADIARKRAGVEFRNELLRKPLKDIRRDPDTDQRMRDVLAQAKAVVDDWFARRVEARCLREPERSGAYCRERHEQNVWINDGGYVYTWFPNDALP